MVAVARLLFFAYKKKCHCADGALAGNGLRRLESQGAAGLKKRLPVLPTARWRALDRGSVVAVARLLFFAYKKKVSLRTCNAGTARGQ